MRETIEESAAKIWGVARDLASPHASGASLNSERNIKYIASMLSAYAALHAEKSLLAMEAYKTAAALEQVKQRDAVIRQLKTEAKKTVQHNGKTDGDMT